MTAVRAFRPSDREGCLALFDSNVPRFFAAEERSEFEAFLDRLPGPYLVIEDAGRVAACGGMARSRSDPSSAVLCWGMVARERHRQGLGRLLLEERLRRLLDDPRVLTITINTSQHSAGFFARQGFEAAEIVVDGFAPGIDRHHMRLSRATALSRFSPPGRST